MHNADRSNDHTDKKTSPDESSVQTCDRWTTFNTGADSFTCQVYRNIVLTNEHRPVLL